MEKKYFNRFRSIVILLFLAVNIFSCVSEEAEPPGCETPPAPTILAPATTFREGETAILEAQEPDGLTGGSFEWKGPNNYLSFNKKAILGKISIKSTGEYKLYYLDENNCRSQPAKVFIALNSEAATCGLSQNKVYIISDQYISNVQIAEQTQIDGNFAIEFKQADMRMTVKFPSKERPVANGLYKVAADSAKLADNELFIKLFYKNNWYNAVSMNKNIQVFIGEENKLYVVLCENVFAGQTTPNEKLTASFNIFSR